MKDQSKENYNFLNQANKLRPSMIAKPSKVLLLPDLEDTPGAKHLYRNYATRRLKNIKILYVVSIIAQVIVLILGELFSANEYTKFGIHEYNVYHIFSTIGWGILLVLEIFFIRFILKLENIASEIIAESLGYSIFWIYLLEIIYLPFRESKMSLGMNIYRTVVLAALTVVLYFIYKRVKLKSNQNFMVSKAEYLGIHLRVSAKLGWVFINSIHSLFETIAYTGIQSIFGWPDYNWAILILTLASAIGVIFLSAYKDIYVTVMLSYGMFGINYLNAFEKVCQGDYRDECLSNVQLCSFILGSVLLILSGTVLILYHKLVCNFEK